jgi:hypothetical protein
MSHYLPSIFLCLKIKPMLLMLVTAVATKIQKSDDGVIEKAQNRGACMAANMKKTDLLLIESSQQLNQCGNHSKLPQC